MIMIQLRKGSFISNLQHPCCGNPLPSTDKGGCLSANPHVPTFKKTVISAWKEENSFEYTC